MTFSKMTLRTAFIAVGAALQCSLTLAAADPQPEADARREEIAVLFTGFRYASCGHPAAKALSEAGFAIRATGAETLLKHRLSLEELRQYHAVVLTGMGRSLADGTLSDLNRANIAALVQYVREGGGVFFIPTWVQDDLALTPMNAFAQEIGLELFFDETPFDPENAVEATAWEIPFSLTRHFEPHPATEGVNALWYPVATRKGAEIHSFLFRPDASWSLLGSSAPSAYSRRNPMSQHSVSTASGDPGTFSAGFPLLACRDFGKGRIAVFSVSPKYLFERFATTTLEDIVLRKGLRGTPSDGWRLFRNVLNWISEPSRESAGFGGAKTDPALLDPPNRASATRPWAGPDASPAQPFAKPHLRGVVGARTRHSTGSADVAEWARQAKAVGLDYLVFLEEFTEMTHEGLETLKRECAAVSDDAFLAVPGYVIDDEIGNHYFFFAPNVPYPDAHFLDDAGKVFVSRDASMDPRDPRSPKGQLSMTLLDFALGKHIQFGVYGFSSDAAPFANWFANWDAIGVVTRRNGKTVEDATEAYLAKSELGQGPFPYVIDLMDDPAMLVQTPWRSVLRMDLSDLPDYFETRHFYPGNPTDIYVTQGPVIETWGHLGPRDYEGRNDGDFVWQNQRRRIVGRITSPTGLVEIAVMDGTRLFRRFLPGGAKDFAFTLDLAQDRQRTLVMIATDASGGKAASHELWNRNHRLQEFNCSDRNNQLSYGLTRTRDGEFILLGGNQALATPSKRIDTREVSPSGVFKNDERLGAPAFDGAAGGEPTFFAPITFNTTNGAIRAPLVCEAFRLLLSGDVNIGEGLYEHRFTDGIREANVWHTLWRTTPSSNVTARVRRHFFQIDPESPLAVLIWDIDVTLKSDLPNRGLTLGFLRTAKDCLWSVRGSDGTAMSGLWTEDDGSAPRRIDLPGGPGAYAALLDSPLGGAAVFPLDPRVRIQLALPRRSNPAFVVPPELAPTKAGDTASFRFVILGIPRVTGITRTLAMPSTETVERFRRDFGLDGSAPAYSVDAVEGTVLSAGYPLAVAATNQVFSGVVSGDLVSSLPITVSGLNDRWSCVLYDRGRKAARPVGTFEGAAWATVVPKTKKPLDLFIGHPVSCDNPEVFIQTTQMGEDLWTLEVNNPTDDALEVALLPNPRFDPLANGPWKGETLAIPAGGMIRRDLQTVK